MDIFVYADWNGLQTPRLMGKLFAVHTKGREVFSFAYDKVWLDSGMAQNLDPDLQLYSGPQYLSAGKANFGIFLDSSPDCWGACSWTGEKLSLPKLKTASQRCYLKKIICWVFLMPTVWVPCALNWIRTTLFSMKIKVMLPRPGLPSANWNLPAFNWSDMNLRMKIY